MIVKSWKHFLKERNPYRLLACFCIKLNSFCIKIIWLPGKPRGLYTILM